MTKQLAVDPILSDFRNFLFLVWAFLKLPKPTEIQYEIGSTIQHGPKRLIIKAFRGVGKSWILAAYCCWRLLKDPQIKILVVSASKAQADNFSTFVLQLIRGMPELQHLTPRDDQRNAKIQFDVALAEPSKDPSLKSIGITGMLTGSRADLIIPDDIETPGNSMTQLQRDRVLELTKEFEALLKPGGEIRYLGTPQCEMSLYNTLGTKGYTTKVWPARYPNYKLRLMYGDSLASSINKAVRADKNLEGKSTEPDRFTDEDLAQREAVYGRSGFQLQFMLDTSLSDANKYPLKTSDLICMSLNLETGPPKVVWAASPDKGYNDIPNLGFTGDRFYQPMWVSDKEWLPYTGAVMAIDPSGRGSNETAYAVIKMLHGYLFLVDWGGFLGGYSPDTLEALALVAKTNGVKDIIVESNFGDGMFTSLFAPVLTRLYGKAGLEEIRSSVQKEKRIIDTLEPVMNGHKLIIDLKLAKRDTGFAQVDDKGLHGAFGPSDAHDYRQALRSSGIYQLTHITREKGALPLDDRLDALAMAVARCVGDVSRDVDQAVAQMEARREKEWFKKFMEHAVGDRKYPQKVESMMNRSRLTIGKGR